MNVSPQESKGEVVLIINLLDGFYKALDMSNKQYPTGNRSNNKSTKSQSEKQKWFRNIKEIHICDGTTVKGYSAYLKTDYWLSLRTDMIIMSGFRCMKCGKKTNDLEVHHLTYDTLGFEKHEDLMVLCRKCHYREHYK